RLRRELDELPRELYGRPIGVAARRERQDLHLAPDRLDDAWGAVADLLHGVAVEVQGPAALGIGGPGAIRLDHRVEAGRRKRLVQEKGGILVDQRARLGIEVRGLPASARRREVRIALGQLALQRQRRRHGRSPLASRPSISSTTGTR